MKEKLLSQEQKSNLKDLLNELAWQIKAKEEISGVDTKVDDKILSLSAKVENLETESDANELLNELKDDLVVLKEYNQFKEILKKLEAQVEKIKSQYTQKTKKELSSLEKQINPENLTPEQLKKLADKWRKQAAKNVWWIVTELAKRDDWIWKLAQKIA